MTMPSATKNLFEKRFLDFQKLLFSKRLCQLSDVGEFAETLSSTKVLIKLLQKFGPRQGPAAQRLTASPRAWGHRR